MSESGYELSVSGSVLSLRTQKYTASEGSVLHSGIFNRELVSSLIAGSVLVAVVMAALISGVRLGLGYIVPAIVLFTFVFLIARFFVLSEETLDITVDRMEGRIVISSGARLRRHTRSFDMASFGGVRSGAVVIDPVNKDGIRVVEKIALQHGMHIPGFGEKKKYNTLELMFNNGEAVMIFASEDGAEAERLADALIKFMGGSTCPKELI